MKRTQVLAGHLRNDKYKEMWSEDSSKLVTKKGEIHPHLQRNFAPTTTEGAFPNLIVSEGKLPVDMAPGCYMRIGPNPKFDFQHDVPYHSFDGDGVIHSVTFPANGAPASYVKRWVRTRRLVTSEERGFDVSEIGEQLIGGFTYVEHVFDKSVNGPRSNKRMGRANTNLVAHADRLFALEEQDLPYQIVASWDLDSHLRTVGRFDFQGKLSPVCTAHPKVCAKTGEMMTFGYDPVRPVVRYTVVSRNGTIERDSIDFELPDTDFGSMMHDFAITEHYSLLFDMRLTFDLSKMGDAGANPWEHRRDLPARFGVLPRHAKNNQDITWINVKSCAVFHFANAWEEQDNVTGNTVIYVVGSRMETFNFGEQAMSSNNADYKAKYAQLYKWKLDLKTGQCTDEYAVDPNEQRMSDFPQINNRYVGQKTRYVYAQSMIQDLKQVHPDYAGGLYLIKGSLKYDLLHCTVQEQLYKSKTGGQMLGTEAVFAPKINAKSEDDGYLIVYAYDEATGESNCLIYDNLLRLVCRLEIPERIPFGFHGYWTAGSVLK